MNKPRKPTKPQRPQGPKKPSKTSKVDVSYYIDKAGLNALIKDSKKHKVVVNSVKYNRAHCTKSVDLSDEEYKKLLAEYKKKLAAHRRADKKYNKELEEYNAALEKYEKDLLEYDRQVNSVLRNDILEKYVL